MPTNKINLKYPKKSSIIDDTKPIFEWEELSSSLIDFYHLKVVEVSEHENIEKNFKTKIPVFEIKRNVKKERSLSFSSFPPKKLKVFTDNTMYAYAVLGFDKEGHYIAFSEINIFFIQSQVLPFNIENIINCTNNLLSSDITNWKVAYGNPSIQSFNGTINLKGNSLKGDAVRQIVEIAKDKRYSLNLSITPKSKKNNYSKLRIYAVNNFEHFNLRDNKHLELNKDVQIIYETSQVFGNELIKMVLPPWYAHNDFSELIITAMHDEDFMTECEVSKICFFEYTADDCGKTIDIVEENGNIKLSEELEKQVENISIETPLTTEFNRGKVIDIYGDMFDSEGKTNWYKNNMACNSLGGSLPREELEDIEKRILENQIVEKEELAKTEESLSKYFEEEWEQAKDKCKQIEAEIDNCTNSFNETRHAPFSGKDIIYVHGLDPSHIQDRALDRYYNVDSDVNIDYPHPDFLKEDGYYLTKAKEYWANHIREHLTDVGKPTNRYLIVTFNCNQRLIYGVHAVLKQIRDAMSEGVGVVDKIHGTGTECFGRDVVVISHSTGALLTNVAMSLANESQDVTTYAHSFLGDVSYISKRVRTHISLHGAIGGSSLAPLAILAANALEEQNELLKNVLEVPNTLIKYYSQILGTICSLLSNRSSESRLLEYINVVNDFQDATSINVEVINNSVLVDLMPKISKSIWGKYIHKNPIPVLTVAGGHPLSFNSDNLKMGLLPLIIEGFDDSVVNLNSQSGSTKPAYPDVCWYPRSSMEVLNPIKIFDLGISPVRAIPQFLAQNIANNRFAYGSIPFISPTGMLQPVGDVRYPLPRYKNHYTFLQSTSNHLHPTHSVTSDEWAFYQDTIFKKNYEETLVVTDRKLFDERSEIYLIHPSIKELVNEIVCRSDIPISFSLPIPKFSFFPLSFNFEWITFTLIIPIWQRSYHLLNGKTPEGKKTDKGDSETHYVYKYVLK